MQFQKAEFVASYGTFSQIPPCNSMEIAFAGQSNVGKSTLINKIFQRKSLARVSAVPGKTATINFYRLDPLTIVDLPAMAMLRLPSRKRNGGRTDLGLSRCRSGLASDPVTDRYASRTL